MNKFSKKIFVFLLPLLLAAVVLLFFTDSVQTELTVIGPIKRFDGIGRQSIELMDCLYGTLSINCIPTNKPCYQDVPSHIATLIKKSNKKLGKIIVYEAPLPTPSKKFFHRLNRYLHGPKNKDQIRIAYSLIESSELPALWSQGLNTYFDAVAVADPYYVDVYKKSGVEIPIFVLPLGLNIEPFLEKPIKSERNKPFCFLNVSSLIPRKNHEGLIQAFNQAFGDNPDVVLMMNYRSTVGNFETKITSLIESLKCNNIILKRDCLDNENYLELFLNADALVTIAKGEGFSIQPREAMALGLPVIISDNTAHRTIVESGLACAIACPQSTPAYNPFLKSYCGKEYIADIQETVSALQDVYYNYEKHLEQREERRRWAARYQFANLKPLYSNLVKPLKIILSDHNEITENGLITSSVDLYNKYLTLFPCTN